MLLGNPNQEQPLRITVARAMVGNQPVFGAA
jgi:hypothetical protein